MGKINVLDKHVAELIAAGEVVERPASIVKELLENSVDANSTCITVEIKNGGISFIRITDDGDGLLKEDMPLAFLRHATSKVQNKDDLYSIETLGFRGEALASISAVAKVELISKVRDSELGAKYIISGGEENSFEDAGCPNGTTIVVRDLFFNVPARQKFLKKDFVEGNAIQSIVEKIALSNPNVSFKFIKDNKLIFHTAGDNKQETSVYTILGKEFYSAIIPIDYEYNGVKITGFVTKPSYSKSNRNMQHFFVNDRYIKTVTGFAAVEEAYKNSMMTSKYPGCVLKISIPFDLVDVNVHPAKTEVKFSNDKAVFEAIYFAIKSVLLKDDELRGKTQINTQSVANFKNEEATQTMINPNLKQFAAKKEDTFLKINADSFNKMMNTTQLKVSSPKSNESADNFTVPSQGVLLTQLDKNTAVNEAVKSKSKESVTPQTSETEGFNFINQSSFEERKVAAINEEKVVEIPVSIDEGEQINISYIGEVFKTYILFEVDEKFVMIDKHAAHERILYEQLKRDITLSDSQMLLIPKILPLNTEEKSIVFEHEHLFKKFGFAFKDDEQNNIIITQAPMVLQKYNLENLVSDIIENISNNKMELEPEMFFELLHSMACRKAIKANAKNTQEELIKLAKTVYEYPALRHCPHGRPIALVYTKYEIEKLFGRIV